MQPATASNIFLFGVRGIGLSGIVLLPVEAPGALALAGARAIQHQIAPARAQLLDGLRLGSLGLVGGTLVATDVHPDLLLEGIDAQPVHHLEDEAERGEDDGGPAKDEEDGDELSSEEGEVPAAASPLVEPAKCATRSWSNRNPSNGSS